MQFAVCATFTIKSGGMESFMPLMLTNARQSIADEDGCQQFDVLTDPAHPNEVFLYEIYDDEAAFQTHLASAHFATFSAATGDLITEKSVKTYAQVAR